MTMTNSLLDGLNPEQVEAVNTTEGPVLVIAAPGSGKTRILTHRIAYLIQQGISPENILAVTFTKKAATEMEQRLIRILGSKDAIKGLTLGTFNSLGVRLLQHHPGKPKLLLPHEQKALFRTIEFQGGEEISFEDFSNYVTRCKGRMLLPGNDPEAGTPLGNFYAIYRTELVNRSQIDFDDQLLLPIRLLETNPGVLKQYQDRFQYLLVDEFQDSNPAQYRLLQLLAAPQNNLFAVGDDAQAIYGFRAADIGIFLGFGRDFPEAKQIVLPRNYRSAPMIIELANRLIRYNRQQIPKTISGTKSAEGSLVRLYEAQDAAQEAAEVVHQIKSLILQGVPLGEISVLYRVHSQADAVALCLQTAGIPFHIMVTDGSAPGGGIKRRGVALTTIHAAKGLEFTAVFLIGLDQGKLPYLAGPGNTDIEEERRLCYVGITRAKQYLHLSYTKSNPSQFLDELLGDFDLAGRTAAVR